MSSSSGIPPVGTSTLPAISKNAKGKSNVQAGSEEREAARRIETANREVAAAERDKEARLEQTRKQYDDAYEHERELGENSLENERMKGYAQMRELKRAQQAELARIQRNGERDQAKLKGHYEDTLLGAENSGKAKLAEIERKQATSETHAQSAGAMTREELKTIHNMKAKGLHDEQERKLAALSDGARKRYEQARVTDEENAYQLEQDYQRRHKAVTDAQNTTLNTMNAKASEAIRAVREDTAQKLAAYQSRQADPFYKLLDTEAALEEKDDVFVLTAKIPEHERDRLSVSVQGDRLLLSGFRRNEEKLELSPGRSRGTSSFQSFTESFPLRVPVESKLLTREFDGDRLIVTIPKHSREKAAAYDSKKASPHAERAKVEQPRFPGNLPSAPGSDGKKNRTLG